MASNVNCFQNRRLVLSRLARQEVWRKRLKLKSGAQRRMALSNRVILQKHVKPRGLYRLPESTFQYKKYALGTGILIRATKYLVLKTVLKQLISIVYFFFHPGGVLCDSPALN